jgi:hypothetical protein
MTSSNYFDATQKRSHPHSQKLLDFDSDQNRDGFISVH